MGQRSNSKFYDFLSFLKTCFTNMVLEAFKPDAILQDSIFSPLKKAGMISDMPIIS